MHLYASTCKQWFSEQIDKILFMTVTLRNGEGAGKGNNLFQFLLYYFFLGHILFTRCKYSTVFIQNKKKAKKDTGNRLADYMMKFLLIAPRLITALWFLEVDSFISDAKMREGGVMGSVTPFKCLS